MVAAAVSSALAHSFTTYWMTWVLIASVGLLRIAVQLLDRRRANGAAPAVRTYVRDSGDPPR
ncbi:MAG TPA: hypothetical protein VE982_07670 [Gaiellaceae bacterium]|nr:hypothetical protein [Gaiellaceae bacterium]